MLADIEPSTSASIWCVRLNQPRRGGSLLSLTISRLLLRLTAETERDRQLLADFAVIRRNHRIAYLLRVDLDHSVMLFWR
jgi:hypothetical protein